MAEIVLKTDRPDKAVQVLKEALGTETLRLKYSLNLAKKRLKRFEAKYNISSKKFMNVGSADYSYLLMVAFPPSLVCHLIFNALCKQISYICAVRQAPLFRKHLDFLKYKWVKFD